jgi:UDP-N-acetylglucosamine--N-acetylmuramyl-(pentapeptide) pyrophosphoryl-undecaprenol N-acetylglucosamine transferase
MKKVVMIVGGGSGGHLTPIVAVAESLKKLNPSVKVIHVGQKGEGLDNVTNIDSIDNTYSITAGKFRRYHGKSFVSHLLDFKTVLLNIRDFFRFIYGTIEAWFLLGKVKPNSIMLKGGFVSVPIGYAARMRKIPYITHDSDAVPGLANKLTATHAVYNTTSLPTEIYPYDQTKALQVGIPIRKEFKEVKDEDLAKYKKDIGINPEKKVIFSVGGGLGAQRVNIALVKASKKFLYDDKNVVLIHLTGKKLFDETLELYKSTLDEDEYSRVKLIDFTTELYKYSSAADVVITRAGATNIAEFAVQGKLCIVVPNPLLTGGQQTHNARILEEAKAAIILNEDSLDKLASTIEKSLKLDRKEMTEYQKSIKALAVTNSADNLAQLLMEI